jgi:WD40 repeat protein
MTGTQEIAKDWRPREPLLRRLRRFFFGSDVFISYGRLDGTDYSLKLANELTRRRLDCAIDQWGTEPGADLPPELVRAIARSTLFVLVGSPAAAQSSNVRKEIETFPRRDKVIPISFGRSLEQSPWADLLKGLSIRSEPAEALGKRPSQLAIKRIVNAEGFVSRNRRLRRTFWTTVGLTALIAGAGLFLVRTFQRQAQAAVAEAKTAKDQAKTAGEQAAAANAQATAARNEAARQERLAGAFGLVSEAESLRVRPDDLEESVRKAAAGFERLTLEGVVSVAADRSLRRGLELLRPCLAEIPRRGLDSQAAVALSSDGSLVAVAAERQVELWRISPASGGGRCPGHVSRVASFPSTTGSALELGFQDDRRLVVVETGLVRVCAESESPAWACQDLARFDPAAAATALDAAARAFAAVEKGSRHAKVWNLVDGSETSVEVGEVGANDLLAVSSSGSRLAFSHMAEKREVFVFPLSGSVADQRFPIPGFATRLVFSRDGALLAAAAGRPDHEVLVWDLKTGEERSFAMGARQLTALAFSPEGTSWAGGGVGAAEGAMASVSIWDVFGRREISRVVQTETVRRLAYSSDGRRMAVVSGARPPLTLRVWETDPQPAGTPLFAVRQSAVLVRAALSADGRYFAAFRGKRLEAWDLESRRLLVGEDIDSVGAVPLTFSAGGHYLLTVPDSLFGQGGRLRAWTLPDGKPAELCSGRQASFDRADRLVACGTPQGLEVREIGSAKPPVTIASEGDWRTELGPLGGHVAAADRTGLVRAWRLSPGAPPEELFQDEALRDMDRPVRMSWSPDERFLAVMRLSGVGTIWEVGATRAIHRFAGAARPGDTPFHRSFAFSADSRLALSVTHELRELQICDLERKLVVKLPLSRSPVYEGAFAVHPDGRHAAVALDDGSIEIWDVVSRRRVAHLGLGAGASGLLAFAPDPRFLVSLSRDGSARRWLWLPQDLIAEARRRLNEPPVPAAGPRAVK